MIAWSETRWLQAPTATTSESYDSVAPSLVVTVRLRRVDRGERAAHELGAELANHVRQRMVRRVAEAERLGHRQRPVHEVRLGSEQGDADAIAGQLAQRDQRLEGGDAAAGDHDVRG